MPIEARIEDERGFHVAELRDPRDLLNCVLSLRERVDRDDTKCVRFIDPYGNTVFNGLQLPVLIAELQAHRPFLTEAAIVAARFTGAAVSVSELREYLESLIDLLNDAIDRGPHHYVRFLGD